LDLSEKINQQTKGLFRLIMQSLVCKYPGLLEYEEISLPVLKPGQAILRIKRVGICGTDLHAFQGNQPFFEYPRIMGHELAADLIEYDPGAVDNPFKPGDPLTIIPYFNCGFCIACRNGKPNCCVSLKVCGVHIDGAMVDYLSVPAESLVPGEGLSYDELALIEPLAIGAHAVFRAAIKGGEFVLISGAGPIGLAAMEFCRLAGAKIIVLELSESRIQYCRTKQKADFVLSASSEHLEEQIREITYGDMATVLMDATGNRQAINGSFRYLASGGRYILIGLQKEQIEFSHPEFHRREATLMSSRNATRKDFMNVIDCLKKGRIKASDFITDRVPFRLVRQEFGNWLDPARAPIKAMVQMD
jgi:2-desacetyl-2-hydroxyethyl bacteriochlorophyllide A dehydrogenase